MVSPTLGREVIRRDASAARAPDILREIVIGLRYDTLTALRSGASVVETKFTLTVEDARALADEIARLQMFDAPEVLAPEDLAGEINPPWGLVCCIALMGLAVLAIPVGLSILGLMP